MQMVYDDDGTEGRTERTLGGRGKVTNVTCFLWLFFSLLFLYFLDRFECRIMKFSLLLETCSCLFP
jgi:hypothetical protein